MAQCIKKNFTRVTRVTQDVTEYVLTLDKDEATFIRQILAYHTSFNDDIPYNIRLELLGALHDVGIDAHSHLPKTVVMHGLISDSISYKGGTNTYIVTYLSANKLEVGPQHILQSYEEAVEVAANMAVQMDEGLDRDVVKAELNEYGTYESDYFDWAVVIGCPDTEE
jgi:hypothetical protein